MSACSFLFVRGSGEVSVYSLVVVSAGSFGFQLRIRMWSGGSSSQQNEEDWEMDSSRKAKNQAPQTVATNCLRGSTYSADKLGNGAQKGKGSYDVDDQNTGRWVNPSSDRDQGNKQQGWKESRKPRQGNVNHENWTTTHECW